MVDILASRRRARRHLIELHLMFQRGCNSRASLFCRSYCSQKYHQPIRPRSQQCLLYGKSFLQVNSLLSNVRVWEPDRLRASQAHVQTTTKVSRIIILNSKVMLSWQWNLYVLCHAGRIRRRFLRQDDRLQLSSERVRESQANYQVQGKDSQYFCPQERK